MKFVPNQKISNKYKKRKENINNNFIFINEKFKENVSIDLTKITNLHHSINSAFIDVTTRNGFVSKFNKDGYYVTD